MLDDAERAVLEAAGALDIPGLPPPPRRPHELECCGRGCIRCIWVWYEEAFEAWRQAVNEAAAAWRSGP